MARPADSNETSYVGDATTDAPAPAGIVDTILRTPVLYPNEYVWFVVVSSMDIMLTWRILARKGTEVNPLARLVIENWGLPGAIVFKFTLMVFVIMVCEYIGRTSRSMRWLATLAVGVSALPVVYSMGLLAWHIWLP